MEEKILVAVIVLWIIIAIRNLYKGFRAKRLSYGIKKIINSTRWGLTIIWSIYFIMGAISLLVPITKWAEQQQSLAASSLGQAIIGFAPLVYLFTIIYIFCRVSGTVSNPFIKYNKKEIEWQKEDTEKLKSRLPQWLYKVVKSL